MEKKILLILFTLSALLFARIDAKAQTDCFLECPTETMMISIFEGEGYEVPNFYESESVTYSDECLAGEYSQSPAPGTILEVGEHNIDISLDFEGDISSCSFSIIIEEGNQGGGKCTVVCPAYIYVTPENGSYTVPDFFLDETIFFGGCEPTDRTQSPEVGTVFSGDTLEIFLTYTIDGVPDICNFNVILDHTTSINKLKDESAVVLYPNPARNNVSIISPNGMERVTIFDITGKEVLSTTSSDIDVSLMNKGMYFVEIRFSTGRVTKRLVVE